MDGAKASCSGAPRTRGSPTPRSGKRAQKAWTTRRLERAAKLAKAEGYDFEGLADKDRERLLARAGFVPIGLHECRHTFASLMIAAGINAVWNRTPAERLAVILALRRLRICAPVMAPAAP